MLGHKIDQLDVTSAYPNGETMKFLLNFYFDTISWLVEIKWQFW